MGVRLNKSRATLPVGAGTNSPEKPVSLNCCGTVTFSFTRIITGDRPVGRHYDQVRHEVTAEPAALLA